MDAKIKELLSTYSCSEGMDNLEGFTPKQIAILQAALKLFSDKGYAATTTAEIAKVANTSEKTLFKYFPTKQILFNHIFYPCLLDILNSKPPIVSTDMSLYDLLFKIYKEKSKLCRENPALLKLMIHRFFLDEKFRNVLNLVWTEIYTPVIEKYLNLSPKALALYGDNMHQIISKLIINNLISYCINTSLFSSNENDEFSEENEIKLILDILLNGMGHVNEHCNG